MADALNYEYVDESSIDPELICVICNAPFNDPVCTPCDHTFCRKCITGWIDKQSGGCPTCRHKSLSKASLIQASRPLRNMLDRLPVRCIFCGKVGLQRSNFADHTSKACSKVHVPCPSADIKCPWTGSRDQLNNHVATCVFQPFRSILSELMAKNRQLEEQIKQQDAHIKQQDTQIKQQDAQINRLINQLSGK